MFASLLTYCHIFCVKNMSENDGFFTENVMKLGLDKMWKMWYNIYACHRRVSQTSYREASLARQKYRNINNLENSSLSISLALHNKKPGALRNFGLFIN